MVRGRIEVSLYPSGKSKTISTHLSMLGNFERGAIQTFMDLGASGGNLHRTMKGKGAWVQLIGFGKSSQWGRGPHVNLCAYSMSC